MKTGALIRAAVRLGAAAGRALRARRRARARRVCRARPGSRSRSSTTCSTSRARRPRSARPPARTPRRASRPTCRCSGSTPRARRRTRSRAEARAALAGRGGVAPAGRDRRRHRAADALTMTDAARIDRLARRPAPRSTAPTLPQVARELRAFLLESVAQTGGHLSSNLGTVELTIALHYVVRHAARPHRVGRRPPDLRAQDADRPPRGDGEAAAWTAGRRASRAARRASTTRSAPRTRRRRSRPRSAWRMAAKLAGEARRVVAVIGDGAMSAGHGVRGAEQRRHRAPTCS